MSGVVLVGLMAGAAVVAVVFGLGAHGRLQRQRELPVIAARAGLHYSDVDRFNTTGVAFPLFRAGDGREVTNLMWRDGSGPSPTRVFDYAYYKVRDATLADGANLAFTLLSDSDVTVNSSRSTGNTWQLFTCALAQHNGNWPSIRIGPEGLVERAFQKLGLPDIDFESEEFNRTFVVQCPDRRFASAFIDPQMMDFLLRTGGEISFETRGRFLLVTAPRLPAARMPTLLRVAEELLERVPPVVRELYPSFPEGAGTDVFPMADASGTGGSGAFLLTAHERDPDAWDPTPGVDHDLDGQPVTPVVEDPWHDRPLPPHAS